MLSEYALDKGKPVATQGRKARGPKWVARPPKRGLVPRFNLRLVAVGVAAALAIPLLPAVSSAQTTSELSRPDVGLHFHAMWSDYSNADRLAVLDKIAASGMKWISVDFGWSSLQPTSGTSIAQWYVDRADFIVNEARARGLNVFMPFSRTPAWANGGNDVNVPPIDPQDYANAARWVTEHFRGRVSAWGVYNEPNHASKDFWTGTVTDYAQLLKAAYPGFKAGDPDALVVAANVVYNDDAWIRQMYAAGAAGSFDVMGVHPYQGVSDEAPELPDNGTKWRLTHVPAVHQVMCDFGDCNKPIWFTEFGWSSHENTGVEGNWARGVTEEQQADYAVRAIELTKNKYPYVTNAFWYNDRTRTTGKPQLDNYGVLNRADLSEKPVYTALKNYLATEAALPTPPSPAPPIKKKPRNLLVNGSFESGTTGWRTDSTLYTVSDSVDTGRSGKVVDRRKTPSVLSRGVRAGGRGIFRVTGFAKSPVVQQVRLILVETLRNRALKRRFRTIRVGDRWTQLPTVRLPSTGRRNSMINVRIRGEHKSFLVDKLTLQR